MDTVSVVKVPGVITTVTTPEGEIVTTVAGGQRGLTGAQGPQLQTAERPDGSAAEIASDEGIQGVIRIIDETKGKVETALGKRPTPADARALLD